MPPIGLDACLRLVADRRRRDLIQELRFDETGQTAIDDLIDRLDRRERIASTDRPPNRDELALTVHHTHLPKLADFGIVDYDSDRGIVQYRPDERLEAVVDALPEELAQPDPSH